MFLPLLPDPVQDVLRDDGSLMNCQKMEVPVNGHRSRDGLNKHIAMNGSAKGRRELNH